MSKFIRQILVIIILPITIAFIIGEYIIRQIPNDYSYKNNYLTENSNTIEILNLGSSHGFYGINPVFFEKPAFNASHVSQSLNYDNFIFNNFFEEMNSLKYIILPISYFTPISQLEIGKECWRVNSYHIYYDCKYHRFNPKYNFELVNLRSSLLVIMKTIFSEYSRVAVNELGFGVNYSTLKKTEQNDLENSALIGVRRHTQEPLNYNILRENKEYVTDIVEKCKNKDVTVILLTTPVVITYYENVNGEQQEIMEEFCESFVEMYTNVIYLDMMQDNRFSNDDFYDGDHLNEVGAKKLTLILNDAIKKMEGS